MRTIAYFVYNLNSYSGAAQQAFLLAKHLKKKIIFFNVENKNFSKWEYNNLIQIIDLPKKNIFYRFLIVIFYTFKYKIKFYHFHGLFLEMLLGVLLRRKIILKTTLLGEDDFDSVKKRKLSLLFLYLIKRVDKNIVLSEKLYEINSRYIDKSKIAIIPNGVIIDSTPPQLSQKEDIFCFVGIICERKRVYESIKYFIDNYSAYKTTKMYLIGPYRKTFENREINEEYVYKCFQLIHQYGLKDRIIFTGLLEKSKIIEIFKKSKALIFFSNKEGMPNAVLEAMVNNCVPITTEIGGVAREIFEDKKHGFILDDDFKKVGIGLINDLIEKKAPYNRVKAVFDINIIVQRYRQIYEE